MLMKIYEIFNYYKLFYAFGYNYSEIKKVFMEHKIYSHFLLKYSFFITDNQFMKQCDQLLNHFFY
jgi:hypothetical protein